MTHRTVLYVEDDDWDRFFMGLAFQKSGLEGWLRVVPDGGIAIDYLSGKGEFADRSRNPIPRLVLLDLNLPGVNGFEVLEWIRGQLCYRDLPVVVLTSSLIDSDRATAKLLGANDFLTKPSSGLDFVQSVRALKAKWLMDSTVLPTSPSC